MGKPACLRWTFVPPLTTSALSLLILLPLVRLVLPDVRKNAAGDQETMHRLLAVSELLQSHRVQADQPPPDLWSQRLGSEEATRLWVNSNGAIWWTAWLSDGPAVLVLPATPSDPPAEQSSLRLEFADDLHAKVFVQQSAGSRPLRSRLMNQCLDLLREGPAVHWTPAAVPSMAGPIARLLPSVSNGCLRLTRTAAQIRFSGVVSSLSLEQAPAGVRLVAPLFRGKERLPMTPVADDALLLRLESPAADQLLRRFLTNESIQQSLESNFGLPSSTLTTLLKAPLQIRLTPVSRGPFQAVVHMNLRLAMPRAHLASTLNRVGKALEERGLVRQVVDVINPDGRSASEAVVWSRADGPPLGGWIVAPSDDSLQRLALSLGGSPLPSDPGSTDPGTWLSMTMLPRELVRRGLMADSWSETIQQAVSLKLQLQPLFKNRADWQWLEGQLAEP